MAARFAFVFLLIVAGCNRRDTAACIERCHHLVGNDDAVCRTVCTRPCAELHDTFGMDVSHCRWVQEGGREPTLAPLAPLAPPDAAAHTPAPAP